MQSQGQDGDFLDFPSVFSLMANPVLFLKEQKVFRAKFTQVEDHFPS